MRQFEKITFLSRVIQEQCHKANKKFNEEQYKEVVDICNKIIKLAPDFYDAYSMRASAYHKLGNKEQAKNDLTVVLERGVGSQNDFHLMGLICFREQNDEKAITYFSKAIQLGDNSEEVYFFLTLSFNYSNADKALETINNGIKQCPDSEMLLILSSILKLKKESDLLQAIDLLMLAAEKINGIFEKYSDYVLHITGLLLMLNTQLTDKVNIFIRGEPTQNYLETQQMPIKTRVAIFEKFIKIFDNIQLTLEQKTNILKDIDKNTLSKEKFDEQFSDLQLSRYLNYYRLANLYNLCRYSFREDRNPDSEKKRITFAVCHFINAMSVLDNFFLKALSVDSKDASRIVQQFYFAFIGLNSLCAQNAIIVRNIFESQTKNSEAYKKRLITLLSKFENNYALVTAILFKDKILKRTFEEHLQHHRDNNIYTVFNLPIPEFYTAKSRQSLNK